jgi:predicted nucleic acid-binding Zn ribbon protein
MRRVERVGDVLRGFLHNRQLSKGLARWEVVVDWPALVGEEIANHSEALELKNGILWVSVPSSSWRQHILFLKPQILRAMDKKFPDVTVKDIRCVSGSRRRFDS